MNYLKYKSFFSRNKKFIYIALFGIFFFFGRWLFSWFSLRFQRPTASDFALKVNGVISPNLANLYASQLFNAMTIFGTDVKTLDAIYNQLKDIPHEVYKVFNAFGTKRYVWFGRSYFFGDDKNLWGWLLAELRSDSPTLERWRSLLKSANLI